MHITDECRFIELSNGGGDRLLNMELRSPPREAAKESFPNSLFKRHGCVLPTLWFRTLSGPEAGEMTQGSEHWFRQTHAFPYQRPHGSLQLTACNSGDPISSSDIHGHATG